MVTRRDFIKAAAGVAAAGLAASAGAGGCGGIRLGGPIFVKSDDPEELAKAHRELGYSAAYCPDVSLKDPDRIKAVRAAYARHGVTIAEVGCWVNLMNPDEETRRKNLDKVTDALALAEAVGACCCVDIAGSLNPQHWYGPHPGNLSDDFFDAAVENARKIIDAVHPKRTRFCYEMMGWIIPDSPDCTLRLIKAIDRDGFGVHLDPCNLVNCPERFYRNSELIEECFDKLGPHIVSCHAKDLTWDVEMNVHFREVRPGTGMVDYAAYLRRLSQLPGRPPLMLEHLKGEEEYDLARAHILKVGQEAGVSFE